MPLTPTFAHFAILAQQTLTNILTTFEALLHATSPPTNHYRHLNRHANFGTVGRSIFTLVRCVTGEAYNGIMHEVMGDEWGTNALRCCPTCGPVVDDQPVSSCGRTSGALILFVSFQVVLAFVIVSLFIGVFMEHFDQAGRTFLKKVTPEQLEDFRAAWATLDPHCSYFIRSSQLVPLLLKLPQPLGIADCSPPLTRLEQLKHLAMLYIPDRNGRIFFTEAPSPLTPRPPPPAQAPPATTRASAQPRLASPSSRACCPIT